MDTDRNELVGRSRLITRKKNQFYSNLEDKGEYESNLVSKREILNKKVIHDGENVFNEEIEETTKVVKRYENF